MDMENTRKLLSKWSTSHQSIRVSWRVRGSLVIDGTNWGFQEEMRCSTISCWDFRCFKPGFVCQSIPIFGLRGRVHSRGDALGVGLSPWFGVVLGHLWRCMDPLVPWSGAISVNMSNVFLWIPNIANEDTPDLFLYNPQRVGVANVCHTLNQLDG